jgi:DNA-binding NarL/FixJ family response regulator
MPKLRIVVAEDHRLLAEAYAHLLRPIGTVVASVADGAALLDAVAAWSPDLVITDLTMPVLSGIEAVRILSKSASPPPVVVVTVSEEGGIVRAAFAAGARGYVLKSAASSELLDAAQRVVAGGTYISPRLELLETDALEAGSLEGQSSLARLTRREVEVLKLVAEGCTARSIAAQLGISESTVNFHKERLRNRLGVRSTMQAVTLLHDDQRSRT